MSLQAFTIYDRKSMTYARPFFAVDEAEATRIFMAASLDQQTNLFNYPSDYELYKCGEFDQLNAAFANCNPEFIIRGDQAQATFLKYQKQRNQMFEEAQGKQERSEVEEATLNQPS